MKRSRLRRVSKKRTSQHMDYEMAKARCWHRDQWCQGPARGLPNLCAGPLDCHHIASQRMYPELRTDPDNLVLLCRGHHELAHSHPREARELGLIR